MPGTGSRPAENRSLTRLVGADSYQCRAEAAQPHSDPQLRTRRTVDSWVWLGATEGGLGGYALRVLLTPNPRVGSNQSSHPTF